MTSQEHSVEQARWPGTTRLLIATSDSPEEHEILLTDGSTSEVSITAADIMAALLLTPGPLEQKRFVMRSGASNVIAFANQRICMNDSAHSVTADGRGVQLPPKEYASLLLLARNAGEVVPVSRFVDEIWQGDSLKTSDNVSYHVSRIRRLLGPELGNKERGAIRTVRKVGWMARLSLLED